jgi:hypothetical protein
MLSDLEISALLEQAARNLDTLELLAREASEQDPSAIEVLRQRLHDLKRAYTKETDALTRQVLQRAVERRLVGERRRKGAAQPQPVS